MAVAMRETSPAHIVVLNDRTEMLELFRDLLEDSGYRVTTGKKLYESVDDLVAEQPDLLILDFLWSGDQTGWDFLQQVRQDPRCHHLPVILCSTGGKELTRIEQHLQAMRVAVVRKPFELSDLIGAVCDSLGSVAPPA
jgi:CheY-like chemotaxis protein